MKTQEMIGVMLIPFSYLVVTFLIVLHKGRKQEARYGKRIDFSTGKEVSNITKRLKTWSVGAIGLTSICIVMPFGESISGMANAVLHALPVFLQPLVGSVGFLASLVFGFCWVLTIFYCMYACDDHVYDY